MSYLLWIITTIITKKSIVINLVQVSKQLPWGSSVGKLNFHGVNPELHSSPYITSGTQQEMFGVMCLDKKIEFAQRYLKIHCKSTLVKMRIEPGSSLSEVNIKIRGERISCCWKISGPASIFLTSFSPSHHRRAEHLPESQGEILTPVKSKGLFLLTSMGPGFHPQLFKIGKLFGTICYSERPWEIYVILFRKPLLMSHI